MFWDFISLRPETTHQVSFLFSDHGIPDGYRHMNGYGSHTFKLVNKEGVPVYYKFHYIHTVVVVHGGQKIESAQKIHASRGWCEIHASQFWWVWPLRFRSYGSFLFAFKTAKFSLRTMGYSPWGSKNRIGSKNSCK